MAQLNTVDIPQARMKVELARILKREGYILDYTSEESGRNQKTLRVYLKYTLDRKPVMQGVKRMSKPSLRQYVGSKQIPRVLGGLGVAILSTSSGILSDREARKTNVGGEVLCYVW
jgi:small subunit ribosomal protein S8